MKKYLLPLFGLAVAAGATAAPLTPEQALQRASAGGAARIASKNFSAVPAYTVKTDAGTPAAYVFKADAGDGFTILAGDDIAYPVLGYSDNGKFDPNNLPESMKWWLNEYSRQISWAMSLGAGKASAPALPSEWTVVDPLVKSKWDQDAPYNNDCPTPRNSTEKCYTGCVATSMAQVMNYFKYPEVGEGLLRYTCENLNRTLVMQLANYPFDWDNMLNNYVSGEYNDKQAAAVALLMKACGYSVEMDYGLDASGAQGVTIGSALRDHFKYDGNTRSEMRSLYSMSQWSKMVYDNLKNIGPVIMNGRSPQDGGHSFVCDGYDGKGYFHFNWGWSGLSDGYFSLEALNPDAQGIGGYAGGFNFGQNAIFGIQPPTGEPAANLTNNLLQYGNASGSVSGSVLTIIPTDYSPVGWGNPTDHNVKVSLGVSFQPVAGGDATVVDARIAASNGAGMSSVDLSPGSYYSSPTVSLKANIPSLSDGKYKVVTVTKYENEPWNEILVPYGYNNYVILTKSGNNYTVESQPIAKLTIDKVELTSALYYNKNARIAITVSNNTDLELSQGFAPNLLTNGKVSQTGGSILVTVPAHSTVTAELVTKFNLAYGASPVTTDTPFTLTLYDPQTNVNYGNFGTVTMKVAPKQNSIIMTKLELAGCEKEEIEYGGRTFTPYIVNDAGNLKVLFGYMCRFGYFDGLVKLAIYEVEESNPSTLIPVVDEIYSAYPFLDGGQSKEVEIDYDFKNASANKLYNIIATAGSSQLGTGSFYFNPSGVDGIEADVENLPARYFNLQGIEVKNPEPGQILIKRQGDKVSKVLIK